MSVSMAFFTFLNAWFVSLFFAFPFSVEPQDDVEKDGYPASPRKILWRRLVIIATSIAFCFTLLLALIIKSGIVSLDY